jgi:AraC-like DNA-binding protein
LHEISRFSKSDYFQERQQVSASEKLIGSIAAHWHDFYEIEFFLSGGGTYTVNGTGYPVKKGSLFCMSPTDFHAYETGGQARIINIMFMDQDLDKDLMLSLLRLEKNMAVRFPEAEFDGICQLCRLIVQQEDIEAPFHQTCAESLLNSLLVMVYRKLEGGRGRAADVTLTAKALHYMELHFRDALTLAETAGAAGLSPNYFSRKFHEDMGVTFQEYLVKMRLDYAHKMLLYSDAAVSEICSQAGFGSLAHFLRAFKKLYGQSPKSYRSSLRQERNVRG